MGRVLQVRLMAYTFAEDDVRKAWPLLWNWAFEETRPGFPMEMKGVLELVRALDELYQFGDIPDSLRKVLAGFLPEAVAGAEELQRQLADWNPKAANVASDRIEDALSELEKHTPKP